MSATAELQIAIRAMDESHAAFASIQSSLKGIESSMQQASRGSTGLLDSLKIGAGMGAGLGLVSKGIELVGSAFGAAKGSIVDLNSSLEQSKIAFTTMLGSEEAAAQHLADLQKFAATTPFEFPDLVMADKKLLAMGFTAKDVLPMMTAVGDAVAAVGGGKEMIDGVTLALGQIQSKGKVSAEEMNQLAERGIPAWDMLAKKLGTDIPTAMKLAEQGKVSAGTFMGAFQEGVASRFGGMMAKQALTFQGAMSTIHDVLSMATATAFQPFFKLISEGAIALAGFLTSDTFTAWAQSAADALGGVAAIVGDVFRTLMQVFQGDWSPDASINPIVNAIGMIAVVVRDVVIPAVVAGASAMMSAFAPVVAWFQTNWPLIQQTIAVVIAAIELLWAQHGQTIITVLSAAWTIITTLVSGAVEMIGNVIKLGMQLITGDWQGAWQTLGDMLQTIVNMWATVLGAAWTAILAVINDATGGALTTISTWITDTGTAIANGMTAIDTAVSSGWETVKSTVAGILPAIVTAIMTVWDAIPEDIRTDLVKIATHIATTAGTWVSNLTTAGANMLTAISAALTNMVTAVTTWASVTFLAPITTLATTAGTGMTNAGTSMWTAITGKLAEIVNAVTTWADSTFLAPLRRLVSTAGAEAASIGRGIVDGVTNAINGAAGAVSGAILSVVRGALASAKEALGIQSPSRVWRDQVGIPIGQGVVEGMRSQEQNVLEAAKAVVEPATAYAINTVAALGQQAMAMAEAARQQAMAVAKGGSGHDIWDYTGDLGKVIGHGKFTEVGNFPALTPYPTIGNGVRPVFTPDGPRNGNGGTPSIIFEAGSIVVQGNLVHQDDFESAVSRAFGKAARKGFSFG